MNGCYPSGLLLIKRKTTGFDADIYKSSFVVDVSVVRYLDGPQIPRHLPLVALMTTDLHSTLSRLGLAQYIARFEDEGFETWGTVLDITESDL